MKALRQVIHIFQSARPLVQLCTVALSLLCISADQVAAQDQTQSTETQSQPISSGNPLQGLFQPQPTYPQPGVTLTNQQVQEPPGQKNPLWGLFTPQQQYPQPGVSIMGQEPEPVDGSKNPLLHLFTPQNQYPVPGESLINLEPQAPHLLKKAYEHPASEGESAADPTTNVGAGILTPGAVVHYPNYVPDQETSDHMHGPTVSPGAVVNYPNDIPYSKTSSYHTGDLLSPGAVVHYPDASSDLPTTPQRLYRFVPESEFYMTPESTTENGPATPTQIRPTKRIKRRPPIANQSRPSFPVRALSAPQQQVTTPGDNQTRLQVPQPAPPNSYFHIE